MRVHYSSLDLAGALGGGAIVKLADKVVLLTLAKNIPSLSIKTRITREGPGWLEGEAFFNNKRVGDFENIKGVFSYTVAINGAIKGVFPAGQGWGTTVVKEMFNLAELAGQKVHTFRSAYSSMKNFDGNFNTFHKPESVG